MGALLHSPTDGGKLVIFAVLHVDERSGTGFIARLQKHP